MKTIVAALAGVVLLASPAFAARHSTDAKEREITKQLNLEQAQSAKQQVAANTQTQEPAQSAPAAAPTTRVESAPAPADGGDAQSNVQTNGNAAAPQ